jgi:hypothetical protein
VVQNHKMENNNIDDLIAEGKKQLSDLQQQIEALAETAGKVIGISAGEVTKKADEIIAEAKVNIEAATILIEAKTKEARQSDEFKNLEADGKKAVEEAQVKIQELSVKVNDMANDLSAKLINIFGKK